MTECRSALQTGLTGEELGEVLDLLVTRESLRGAMVLCEKGPGPDDPPEREEKLEALAGAAARSMAAVERMLEARGFGVAEARMLGLEMTDAWGEA